MDSSSNTMVKYVENKLSSMTAVKSLGWNLSPAVTLMQPPPLKEFSIVPRSSNYRQQPVEPPAILHNLFPPFLPELTKFDLKLRQTPGEL